MANKLKRSGSKLLLKEQKPTCSCCDCPVEVRSVTASLSLVGYAPFDCDGAPASASRYLSYSIKGPASIQSCGGWNSNTEEATQTTTIDPFTGLSCFAGQERNSVLFICSDTGTTTCTPTSRVTDCGEYAEQELADYCVSSPDDGAPAKRKIVTETLSMVYTIDDVAANVDTMLSRVNPYQGMPAGVAGSVVNGTGHSVLTWSNTLAERGASYFRSNSSVSKTRLYVKFLEDMEYTLDGETYQATAGQTLVIDPPAEPNGRVIEFLPICRTSVPTTLSIAYDGTTQHATLKEEQEGVGACVPFVGPDCKEYNTKTEISNGSCLSEHFVKDTLIYSDGLTQNTRSEATWDYNRVSYNLSEPSEENCQRTIINGFVTTSWLFQYDDGSTDSDVNTCTTVDNVTDCETEPVLPYKAVLQFSSVAIGGCAECSPNYDCPEVIDEPSTTIPTDEWCNTTTSYALNTSKTIDIQPNVVTVQRQRSSLATYKLECNYESGPPFPSGDLIVTEANTGNCLYSIAFSNDSIPQDSNAENGDKWDFSSSPNNTACASHTNGWNFRSRSNVTLTLNGTFNAAQSEEPVEYEHWFHHVRVQNDHSNEDCPVRTVTAHNEVFSSFSTGGTSTVTTSIQLSTPPENNTVCAENMTVLTVKK